MLLLFLFSISVGLSCYLVVIVVIWCLSFVLLSSFRSSTVYGITIASRSNFPRSFVPSFLHPRICQSPLITEPHPPTRFYCPPQSQNVAFIHKLTLFTDFRPFFARNKVKYEPISKMFSFSDSLQQALQHCRSKFVAKQTSLHQNNYRNFFTGHPVSVR